jgi:hypothetical protein
MTSSTEPNMSSDQELSTSRKGRKNFFEAVIVYFISFVVMFDLPNPLITYADI